MIFIVNIIDDVAEVPVDITGELITIGFDSGTHNSWYTIMNNMRGQFYEIQGQGIAQNMSAEIHVGTSTYNMHVRGYIYEYIDDHTEYAGALLGMTEGKIVPVGFDGWMILNFTDPKPVLEQGTRYYFTVLGENHPQRSLYCYRAGGPPYAINCPMTYGEELDPMVGETMSTFAQYHIQCTYLSI